MLYVEIKMILEHTQSTDKLLSRREAAEMLGVKETTLASWHTTSRYPLTVVKVGSNYRNGVKANDQGVFVY